MLLIKNGHIKPIVGEEIENGSILLGDDGKIAYDTENGIEWDFDGDGSDDLDKNGESIYYDFDIVIFFQQ